MVLPTRIKVPINHFTVPKYWYFRDARTVSCTPKGELAEAVRHHCWAGDPTRWRPYISASALVRDVLYKAGISTIQQSSDRSEQKYAPGDSIRTSLYDENVQSLDHYCKVHNKTRQQVILEELKSYLTEFPLPACSLV